MWNKIKSFFNFASEHGLKMPMVYDYSVQGPSATLLFTYIAFICTIVSFIYLFFKPEVISPAIYSIILFVICLVLYRLKRLSEFSVDLDDKSISIKGSEDEDQKVEKK
jgi:hypothetical protein